MRGSLILLVRLVKEIGIKVGSFIDENREGRERTVGRLDDKLRLESKRTKKVGCCLFN